MEKDYKAVLLSEQQIASIFSTSNMHSFSLKAKQPKKKKKENTSFPVNSQSVPALL